MLKRRWFQGLTREELEQVILPFWAGSEVLEATEGHRRKARYHAKQLFHWVYQRFVTDWEEMSDLPKGLRGWLAEHLELLRLPVHSSQEALDGTHKFLFSLPGDQKTIESVLIPAALQDPEELRELPAGERFRGRPVKAKGEEGSEPDWKRLTACISSQVGCAMGCKFCLTGVQGLDRSLQTAEIVAQVYELRRRAPVTHLVFMGMGEPLHNLEQLLPACRILLDEDGFNFSKRKVTVSTSGWVPGIEQLGASGLGLSLAISLNASTQEQRLRIMPIARKWDLETLLEACRRYPLGSHRRITFEYVLLKDLNDQLEDAARVAELLKEIPCKVNLIPFNEHPAGVAQGLRRPSDSTVRAFQQFLMNRGFVTTVRVSRGQDILAACGQLKSLFGTARGTEKSEHFLGVHHLHHQVALNTRLASQPGMGTEA